MLCGTLGKPWRAHAFSCRCLLALKAVTDGVPHPGKAADVKRCFVMRKALALLDFDSESIGDVKRLLLRAAFLPVFLRTNEGRRFLACLFTLEVMPSITSRSPSLTCPGAVGLSQWQRAQSVT